MPSQLHMPSIETLIPRLKLFIQSLLSRLPTNHGSDGSGPGSDSGDETTIMYASGLPKTHLVLRRNIVSEKGFVNVKSKFVRHAGELDVKDVLHLTRREAYAKAVEAGGNALAEESWTCKIKEKKNVSNITVRYRAKAVISGRMDPQEPVNLDDALAFDDLDHELEAGNRMSWRRKSIFHKDPTFSGGRRISILQT